MHATSPSHFLRSFISSPARCVRSASPLARRGWSSRAFTPVSSSPSTRSTSLRVHASRRTFVSTSSIRAVHAQHPPGHRAELLSYPSPSSLQHEEDPDEPEVELVPPEEAALELTDRAAERLRELTERLGDPDAALRVAVESGGCHGYQYKIDLAKKKDPEDYHFSHPRIKPSNVYVDAVSMTLLKGSTIDFATELIGSSFRVVDNPQAKGNGCGCGVSWELNL